MKREKLQLALDQISDAHIAEAATFKKKRKLFLIPAIAAGLALVFLFRTIDIPLAISAKAVSIASESRSTPRPMSTDYEDKNAWRNDYDEWFAQRAARDALTAEALEKINGFLSGSCMEFLSGTDRNQLYSPINAFIGLAMAAELTAGQTQQQILDVLGVTDTDALRAYIGAIWENVYQDNGNEICTLANSLWLDNDLAYNQEPMDTLAYHYYASVYQQDLSSERVLKDIKAWLNNNTGGMLKNSIQNVALPEEAVLALYSTIYFQSKWNNEFSAANSKTDTFHAPSGDISCTFMNKKLTQMNYYWGESFGAVSLSLKNGSSMWFILPDEDKTISDVLSQGEYLRMITAPYNGWENTKYMKVNLSVPKFNIQTSADLRPGLENMGITDLFQLGKADFSAAFDVPAFITAANQAVQVEVDEQGVKAAAYIELPGAGAAAPPEEIIDFILDRPFLFVIADSSGIPLFAGTVNQP